MVTVKRIGGSFRDPNGFAFVADGTVYRQVNKRYRSNYDQLMGSGLYQDLVDRHLLIPHSDSYEIVPDRKRAYKVLRPEQIPFISYPYEWSFSQLKDAALTTLEIQKRALSRGMILKDASAYNIQFHHGRPLLIDTLSFENYEDRRAWVAYRQFCQHFLAPLVLMSQKDIRLSQLLRVHIDGIPLDLASALLPRRSWLNSGIAMHLQLHARAQRRYAGKTPGDAGKRQQKHLDKRALTNVAESLRSTINWLKWDHGQTSWADYYAGDSYREAGFEQKKSIVSEFLEAMNPKRVWDLGANTGVFSRIAADRGAFTLSIDNDPGVVEANYLGTKRSGESNLHPLLIDLANPSAAIGWANEERDALAERCEADCLLALALIHHIAISNNVPLELTARFFASLAEWLIIEFVPKSDKKARQLLSAREDIFEEYTRERFEEIYSGHYEIIRSRGIRDSDRVLYLMRRRR